MRGFLWFKFNCLTTVNKCWILQGTRIRERKVKIQRISVSKPYFIQFILHWTVAQIQGQRFENALFARVNLRYQAVFWRLRKERLTHGYSWVNSSFVCVQTPSSGPNYSRQRMSFIRFFCFKCKEKSMSIRETWTLWYISVIFKLEYWAVAT